MSPELIRLHISQLIRTIDKSKTNQYADVRKRGYHNKLIDLINLIQKEDLSTYDYNKQKSLKEVLDFIFLSIEFLDNSTLTTIPHEIVFCLEKALNEWDNTNGYIIVTSLQNNISSGYSFNPKLALDPQYYDILNSLFNIKFDYRLIQINLPKYLVNDYLANVVLYHELGHFIELKYKISERLTKLKLHLGELKPEDGLTYYYHTAEYFADIFAAQYVGESSNYYLNYIAHKNGISASHPSTDSRIKIVEDFMNEKTDNDILNEILIATKATTKQELRKRFNSISANDFEKFIPTILKNTDELHSIFCTGWDLWKKEIESFKEKNIEDQEKYIIINNLIEKSISNYMVMERWKE